MHNATYILRELANAISRWSCFACCLLERPSRLDRLGDFNSFSLCNRNSHDLSRRFRLCCEHHDRSQKKHLQGRTNTFCYHQKREQDV